MSTSADLAAAIERAENLLPSSLRQQIEAAQTPEAYAALLPKVLEWGATAESLHRESVLHLLRTERERSLGTLSGGVAHHFNNLLSVILGYASFLLNRTELSDEADDALRAISDAAQKGRRLTEEILAFAGSEVEEETTCSLHEIVESVLSLLESHTAGRIRIQTGFDATDDQIRAPRSVLHQTVFNLLINAIDSMPEGGTLDVRTEPATKNEIPCIRLKVVDTAESIGENQDRSTRARRLSSVRGMIHQLSGTAELPDTQALSNSAVILLPVDRDIPAVPAIAPTRKRLAPSQIWVVDDDPIFCEMCERVLSDDGHKVVALPSGPAMMEAFEHKGEPPHLLIVDFSMPEYNGLEIVSWLREKGCKAPVILVSGFSHTQPDIHKALKIRKTFFLQKPFPVPELADIVSVALGETLLDVKVR